MTLFTHVLMCILGAFFIFMAFYATGARGGLSKGPLQPISPAGRVIVFLAGTAVFVTGSNHTLSRFVVNHAWWHDVLPFVLVALFALALISKRVRGYVEPTVITRPTFAIGYISHLPHPLVGLRVAFFVIVAAMLLFGLAPMRNSTARVGIISCVLSLFAVALLYEVLESYYLRTGRAGKVDLTDETINVDKSAE